MSVITDLISPKKDRPAAPVAVSPPQRADKPGQDTARRKSVASKGRGSTILTSELGVTGGNGPARRKLGGQ